MNVARPLMHAGLQAMQAGQPAEAVERFREALQLAPESADLWANFSVSLASCHRYADAQLAARHAIKLRPDSIHALNALASALDAKGRHLEAADFYRRALALEPVAGVWNNLANSLKSAGRLDDAVQAYREALRLEPQLWRTHSNLLLTLNYHPAQTPQAQAEAQRAFGTAIEATIAPAVRMPVPVPGKPLRIGFVSADFYYHPVGRLFLPVLQARRRGEQTWVLYAHVKVRDELTERIRAEADVWHEIAGLDDNALEARVRADAIDVLVDLSGHTATNRLPFFARHVPPVQAAWMGYAGSTGMTRMDWLIADALTLPPGEEPLYAERIWRVPAPYIALTRPEPVLDCGTPPVLKNGFITLASFNNTSKLTDAVLATWARILAAVPEARLFMKNKGFADAGVRESFTARLARLGVAAERLRFEGETGGEAYYRSFHEVDIALDPFPFPGLLTSLDTLWMGVPVVSMAGQGGMIGHHGELLLNLAGLGDWIARSEDDYVRIATHLAADPAALAQWRTTLRASLERTAVFDAVRLAHELQSAFNGMVAALTHPT